MVVNNVHYLSSDRSLTSPMRFSLGNLTLTDRSFLQILIIQGFPKIHLQLQLHLQLHTKLE